MSADEHLPAASPEAATGAQVRAELEELLARDLLGPRDGPTEELPAGVTPAERYLLGRLVPRRPDDEVRESRPASGADTATQDPGTPLDVLENAGLGFEHDGTAETTAPAAVRGRSMAQSALGLSFSVPAEVERLVVEASWGRYERGPSELQRTPSDLPATVWRRVPSGGRVTITLDPDQAGFQSATPPPDPSQELVTLRWRARRRDSRTVVEISLQNDKPPLSELPDRNRLYQVSLSVAAPTDAAVFLGHNDPDLPEVRHEATAELRLLELQHRSARLYATGRQCAVEADVRKGECRAWRLRTSAFPAAEVPLVTSGEAADVPGLLLDMEEIANPERSPEELAGSLLPLVDAYRRWLDAEEARIGTDPEVARFADVASDALGRAREVADRLERAIALLRTDPVALDAFRFANQAMAVQRVRSELVRRRLAEPDADPVVLLTELDVAATRTWRPFQLAFVLLCIPGLTDPRHPDAGRGPLTDGVVQLLFFPTGGGKTEAYLGLAAYTIAIRRLQGIVGEGADARDGSDGIAVLMRYTLRLLTAQQFQRAATLVCACELLRQERLAAGDRRWGTTSVRIGLWVGVGVSPNTFDDAQRQWEDAVGSPATGQVGGIQQFAVCPWCATPIHLGHDGVCDRLRRRFFLFCGDPAGRCPFSRARSEEGIPALVVDEEIYRLTPALVVATVDKFAQLPWKGQTAHLFGHVTSRCARHGYRDPDPPTWCKDGGHPAAGGLPATRPVGVARLRPPDLVIQDELHLIADALGSMVGLYETLVDHLCTRTEHGAVVRPVLVASTATVRRARQQVRQVFARELAVFPPPVIDAGETFFSRRAETSPEAPGRRYRGVLVPGEKLTAIEIRVATALLEHAQYLFDRHGAAADPYMTLVDYFTSTRELAGMRRLVEDDVTDRLGRQDALVRRPRPTVRELTSRMPSRVITQALADLERRFDPAVDTTAARAALRQLRRDDPKAADKATRTYRLRPTDVLLATSMLQVGVDVQRLGLMVVTGQPKSMAEYIQATSRVGRSAEGPGLVITIFNWNRPRDLAHYEHFFYDHATFGRRVEGLTTTPFANRALDRGLTGVVVGAVRHSSDTTLPNLGAHAAPLDAPSLEPFFGLLGARAELVADAAPTGQDTVSQARARTDGWQLMRTALPAGQLGYEPGTKAAKGLLHDPEELPWTMWHAPMSLRDVEPEILLQLRRADPSVASAPAWSFPAAPQPTAPDPPEGPGR
jgi:hypothetical protein